MELTHLEREVGDGLLDADTTRQPPMISRRRVDLVLSLIDVAVAVDPGLLSLDGFWSVFALESCTTSLLRPCGFFAAEVFCFTENLSAEGFLLQTLLISAVKVVEIRDVS